MPRKLIYLLPTYGPLSGGVGTVVRNLKNGFINCPEYEIEIYDVSNKPKYADTNNLSPQGKNLIFGLINTLKNLLNSNPSITHLHGAWHPLSIPCFLAKKIGSHKHICSPHGMLAEWILKQNSFKKKIVRWLYENFHWKSIDCFHALSLKEADEISFISPIGKPIAVIPNGIPVLDHIPIRQNNKSSPYILYLGRFHKKKGLAELISAWSRLEEKNQFTLKIVGWGELESLNSSLPQGIEILGPVEGLAKDIIIRDAEYLILPSFSEGLPMVVLESWAQGTPVIMTSYCNLSKSFDEGAAIEIEPSSDSILESLIFVIKEGKALRNKMSIKAHRYCKENHSITSMVSSFKRLHDDLLNGKLKSGITIY